MKTLESIKIKDIEEFCKLFKINIPVEQEFEYYIKTLKSSLEFGWPLDKLQGNIDLYIDLEKYTTEQGFSSVRGYKNKCMDTLKDYILSTETYNKLNSSPLPSVQMRSKDHINTVEEFEFLLSLDFKSANYSILKTFDDNNELENSWIYLCEKFAVHPCLIASKSFRQIVFGNTNPKRLQTYQHQKIMLLVDLLMTTGIPEEHFVFISHDEIILKVPSAHTVITLQEKYLDIFEKEIGMPIKTTQFSMKKIKKNTFVKTVYSLHPKSDNSGSYYFSEEYKVLHGVQGHKFYMYFKKFILNKSIDERDLMYINDGELCKWVDEDAVKTNSSLPHYEKPKYSLTMDSAKTDYSYMWDKLSIVLPGMTDEGKRRAIEVFLNTCNSCHNNPIGCNCHKEE